MFEVEFRENGPCSHLCAPLARVWYQPGVVAPFPRDTRRCLAAVLNVTAGGDYCHPVSRGGDAAQHPTVHRTAGIGESPTPSARFAVEPPCLSKPLRCTGGGAGPLWAPGRGICRTGKGISIALLWERGADDRISERACVVEGWAWEQGSHEGTVWSLACLL